ncbi:MAG: hypothetical protein H0U70_01020 [Tatlockia sp.]|nr:hypothetical protein [Tatlockia sp.]
MPRKTDNRFALAILNSTLKSSQCLKVLGKSASIVFAKIIEPLLTKLSKDQGLNEAEQKTIAFLAREHTKEGMQWGGCMRNFAFAIVMANKNSQLALLLQISHNLQRQPNDRDSLAGFMKAMTDCCYCHVEYLKGELSLEEKELKAGVSPTIEELAIRISRADMKLKEQAAISYGIDRVNGIDVIDMPKDKQRPSNVERFDKAGKVAFVTADVKTKSDLLAKKYDEMERREDELLERCRKEENKNPITLQQLTAIRLELDKLRKEMNYYLIPTNPNYREVNPSYLPTPSIQKLAHSEITGKEPLPLVATASGTTARTLIALQNLGAFGHDSANFDVESAQYVATALCGTIVTGGHHSFLEVAEIYNRLLDYHAIKNLESKESSQEKFDVPEKEMVDSPLERKAIDQMDARLAYGAYAYVIGDHLSVVPITMKEMVKQFESELSDKDNKIIQMKEKLAALKETVTINADVDISFGKALFISGNASSIGEWKDAVRMEFKDDRWVFNGVMPVGTEFKLLIGDYDGATVRPVSNLTWQTGPNLKLQEKTSTISIANFEKKAQQQNLTNM